MWRVRLYEWLVGKLMERAARLRARRGTDEDWHEVRHLYAGICAADTTSCAEDGFCTLDRAGVSPWERSLIERGRRNLRVPRPPG